MNAGQPNEQINVSGHYKFSIESIKYEILYRLDENGFTVIEEKMSTGLGISASCLASLCG